MKSREQIVERLEEFLTQLEDMQVYLSRESVFINNWVDIESISDSVTALIPEVVEAKEYLEDIEDEAAHWNGYRE